MPGDTSKSLNPSKYLGLLAEADQALEDYADSIDASVTVHSTTAEYLVELIDARIALKGAE